MLWAVLNNLYQCIAKIAHHARATIELRSAYLVTWPDEQQRSAVRAPRAFCKGLRKAVRKLFRKHHLVHGLTVAPRNDSPQT